MEFFSISSVTIVTLVCGVLALLFAAYHAHRVTREDAGNEKMREISAAIHDGAKAFLFAEYKILVFFA